VPALYDITRHADGTLLVVTGSETQGTLAAMPDSGSFLSHATFYLPGGPCPPEAPASAKPRPQPRTADGAQR
jgi:hypothetical protein